MNTVLNKLLIGTAFLGGFTSIGHAADLGRPPSRPAPAPAGTFNTFFDQIRRRRPIRDAKYFLRQAESNLIQALMCAAKQGDLTIAGAALDKGADVNTKDVLTGRNVLMLAADKGKKEMVELLLNESADVNARSEGRWTVLMIAAEGGYGDIVELLIENGAEVDAENTNGKTALMRAIERG